jgi:hypothetical protein
MLFALNASSYNDHQFLTRISLIDAFGWLQVPLFYETNIWRQLLFLAAAICLPLACFTHERYWGKSGNYQPRTASSARRKCGKAATSPNASAKTQWSGNTGCNLSPEAPADLVPLTLTPKVWKFQHWISISFQELWMIGWNVSTFSFNLAVKLNLECCSHNKSLRGN